MDRELVLALLVLSLVGSTCFIFGTPAIALEAPRSGRAMERVYWRRLWIPCVPGSLVFAALLGWAWREPCDSERPPVAVALAALPFAIVWFRVIVRAIWASQRAGHAKGIATRGLFRPMIVLDPDIVADLDNAALRASIAHEKAHAKHRDPLRIWCAQIVTDLQWPAPTARERLRAWRHALELARDEEAREHGVDGADLAAAIVHVVARGPLTRSGAAAGLTGSEALEDRVARLFEPLIASPPATRFGPILALWALAGAIAGGAGGAFGEHLVRTIAGAR